MTDRPRRTPKPRKPHPYVDPDVSIDGKVDRRSIPNHLFPA